MAKSAKKDPADEQAAVLPSSYPEKLLPASQLQKSPVTLDVLRALRDWYISPSCHFCLQKKARQQKITPKNPGWFMPYP